MPRPTPIDTNPRLIPVNLAAQLVPGMFDHPVDRLLDRATVLSGFEVRVHNDTADAPAYPPAVLLKMVLCAYARRIVNSRAIAHVGEVYLTLISLCGARTPVITTIAGLVRTVAPDIVAVRAVWEQQVLIYREIFAIDAVRLRSNGSKRRNGTRADFE